MADSQAVLFVNEAFYQAFNDGDVAAMDALWAKQAPVACIHPGWHALTDRDSVMGSWRAILTGEGKPTIRCQGAEAQLFGDIALVTCFEAMDQGFLIATNLFVREAGVWKMAHHHAGPTRPPEGGEEAAENAAGTMH